MESEDTHVAPGSAVTTEVFQQWRQPRAGCANPERMNNPVWEWLVRSKLSGYQANQMMGISASQEGPTWSFDRFGQTSTILPDGRMIMIGGEHEDHYDPDFHIYNDVVVQHPNGNLDFFGYPQSVFPPTDFHTATLLGDQILIIGCLGYPESRHPNQTFAAILHLSNFSIEQIQTHGSPPGWIYKHAADVKDGGKMIWVRGGTLATEQKDMPLVENIDDWELDTTSWRWTRLTHRQWPRHVISRRDGTRNHYRKIEMAAWSQKYMRSVFEHEVQDLTAELGTSPDLEVFAQLFHPPLPHHPLPVQDDEFEVRRISVEEVVVRYTIEAINILMTVEGHLPPSVVHTLTADLAHKMSLLENHDCVAKEFAA